MDEVSEYHNKKLIPLLLIFYIMNANDINAFKRFLKSHGVNTMFVGMYNQYRYDDNPVNLQEYLATVPRNVVITYAFDLSKLTQSAFGAKYWDELNLKWKKFINVTNDRKEFELSTHDEKKVSSQPMEEATIVEDNWSGLDLLTVGAAARKKGQMPDDNQVRINTNKKNVMVINSNVTSILDSNGLDTMDIRVDRKTNRFVLVFGKDLKFAIRDYSTEVKCVQHKAIIEYLSKYLNVSFDPKKYYYINIAQRIWSTAHTQYAVILSQKYTTKDA